MIILEDITKTFKPKDKKYLGKYAIKNALLRFFSRKTGNGNIVVLKSISLSIKNGEHVGIIGRNKSGKTTLMQLLSGIAEPDSGMLQVDGHVIPIFSQGTVLTPDLTGREYILLHATALGISKSFVEQVMQRIIDFSEIETIDTPVKFYSTGMRTRLTVSTTLHLPADVYILDEIFLGSDTFFIDKVIRHIQLMMEYPDRIFIHVSHEEGILRNLCERLLLLDNGNIVKDGSIDEVLNYYHQLDKKH